MQICTATDSSSNLFWLKFHVFTLVSRRHYWHFFCSVQILKGSRMKCWMRGWGLIHFSLCQFSSCCYRNSFPSHEIPLFFFRGALYGKKSSELAHASHALHRHVSRPSRNRKQCFCMNCCSNKQTWRVMLSAPRLCASFFEPADVNEPRANWMNCYAGANAEDSTVQFFGGRLEHIIAHPSETVEYSIREFGSRCSAEYLVKSTRSGLCWVLRGWIPCEHAQILSDLVKKYKTVYKKHQS